MSLFNVTLFFLNYFLKALNRFFFHLYIYLGKKLCLHVLNSFYIIIQNVFNEINWQICNKKCFTDIFQIGCFSQKYVQLKFWLIWFLQLTNRMIYWFHVMSDLLLCTMCYAWDLRYVFSLNFHGLLWSICFLSLDVENVYNLFSINPSNSQKNMEN